MTTYHTSPRRLPAGIGLLAAIVSVILVASVADQTAGILVEIPGLVLVVAGLHYHRKSPLGYLAVLGGLGLVIGGMVIPLTNQLPVQLLLEVYGGMIGLLLYAFGIGALRDSLSRTFVTAGVAFVFAGILITGIFQGTPPTGMLGATVACVVAWDAGEQAINLGEHVGSESTAWRSWVTHVGATAAVGLVAIAATLGLEALSVTGLPLEGLLILLAAAMLSLAALYH